MPPRTIALDGPAGSGKSVVGLWLAERLGYAYLDTGLLYRAIAWLAGERGVPIDDGPALAGLAEGAQIALKPPSRLELDGRDVTDELFTPAVNASVSPVAAHPEVRKVLLPIQRRIAIAGRVVVAGRDIGTVVLPDAELKLYLDASAEERARRRWEQEDRRRSLEAVIADVRRRDETDSRRATSPLRPAADAVIIHTDAMPLEEEKRRIIELVDGRRPD